MHLVLVEIETVISVIGGFISAVIAGILLRLWISYYLRPILVIEGNESIITRVIYLKGSNDLDEVFYANRVSIKNIGRSAAKDCKAYIVYRKDHVERAAWMIPDMNSGYTLTLNVQDSEFIDLCAVSQKSIRVIPSERGYGTQHYEPIRSDLESKDLDLTLRITSSNTRPTERRLRIYAMVDHFPTYYSKVVEFID